MSYIKICGLRRAVDIDAVNEGMPDFIGFVFAKSSRQVTLEQAAGLKARLKPEIKAVGVFVNEEPERIMEICRRGIIDIIQLHGDEDDDYTRDIKKRTDLPVIRAIRVKNQEDLQNIDSITCDFLLLDACDDSQYGGAGKSFDWAVIGKMEKPFFLAGGLNENNLAIAAEAVKPYCLDLSSGVETNGVKDREKILKAINIVRGVI